MSILLEPASIRRILVIKLRAIGDVLLSTVVLDNLRRGFPGAEMHFLTEPAASDLLKYHPAIDQVQIFDRSRMSGVDLIRTVRRQRYNLVVDLFGNPRTALVTRLSGAAHRVGYRFRGRTYAYNHRVEPRGDRVHNTEFNLDALQALGLPIHTRVPRITLGPEERAWAVEFLNTAVPSGGPLVAINAGGGWYTKRWGGDRFASLADLLVTRHDARILILWGPGERPDAEGIAGSMTNRGILPPETSLLQLAGLLERCALLVTNDSGPMHIAAAMGTPVLAVFGPTNPLLQGPIGNNHRVVRCEGLNCLGCNLTSCPIGLPCMKDLSVESVYEEARTMLTGDEPALTVG